VHLLDPAGGLAPARPAVRPGEEVHHRLSVVADRLLLHDHAALGEPRVARPRLSELPAPLGEAGHLPAPRPPPGLLLDAQVPHIPGVGAVPQQDLLLPAGQLKTIPGHTNILSKNTHPGLLMYKLPPLLAVRRFPPRPEGRGILRRSR